MMLGEDQKHNSSGTASAKQMAQTFPRLPDCTKFGVRCNTAMSANIC